MVFPEHAASAAAVASAAMIMINFFMDGSPVIITLLISDVSEHTHVPPGTQAESAANRG
jgi:hypothetical protein